MRGRDMGWSLGWRIDLAGGRAARVDLDGSRVLLARLEERFHLLPGRGRGLEGRFLVKGSHEIMIHIMMDVVIHIMMEGEIVDRMGLERQGVGVGVGVGVGMGRRLGETRLWAGGVGRREREGAGERERRRGGRGERQERRGRCRPVVEQRVAGLAGRSRECKDVGQG